MPEIIVIDPATVTIDGVAVGSVADVLANHDPAVTFNPSADDSGFRSALQAALVARDDAIRQAQEAALKSLSDAHVAALAERDASHAGVLAAKDVEATELKATIAEQLALIGTLGGTELGRQMARDKQRQALLDAKAEAEAQLAELEEAP